MEIETSIRERTKRRKSLTKNRKKKRKWRTRWGGGGEQHEPTNQEPPFLEEKKKRNDKTRVEFRTYIGKGSFQVDPTSLRASVRVKGRRQGGIPPTKPDWSKRGQQPIRSRLLTETKEKINMNKTQGWNSGWIFRFQSRCRVDPRSAGIQSAPVAFRLRAKLRAKGRSEGGNGAPAIPSCPENKTDRGNRNKTLKRTKPSVTWKPLSRPTIRWVS